MKCPVCKKKINKDKNLKSHTSFDNRDYKLYQCLECDIQFWDPLKVPSGFYQDETEFACFAENADLRNELSYNQKNFFKYFPIDDSKINLLDVGCGDGIFLREAKKAGFNVWGIDLNEGRIKVAKEKFGIINVFTMGLSQFAEYAKQKELKFDVITFFDVLEHQDDPRGFVDTIENLLNLKGWIAGGVPHRDRLWMNREEIINPGGDFPPHHFLRFNKKSLVNLFGMFDVKIYSVPMNIKWMTKYLGNLLFGKTGKYKTLLKTLFLPISFILSLILLAPYNKKGAMVYFQGKLKNK